MTTPTPPLLRRWPSVRRSGCQRRRATGTATTSPASTSASQFVREPSTSTTSAVRIPNTIAAAVRIGARGPTHHAGYSTATTRARSWRCPHRTPLRFMSSGGVTPVIIHHSMVDGSHRAAATRVSTTERPMRMRISQCRASASAIRTRARKNAAVQVRAPSAESSDWRGNADRRAEARKTSRAKRQARSIRSARRGASSTYATITPPATRPLTTRRTGWSSPRPVPPSSTPYTSAERATHNHQRRGDWRASGPDRNLDLLETGHRRRAFAHYQHVEGSPVWP